VPNSGGFGPEASLAAVTPALASACFGAVSIIKTDSSIVTFAGTSTNLYQLASSNTWTDVTRVAGGNYAVPSGERWRFAQFGNNLIAVDYNDATQVFDVTSSTNFAALGGSPPQGRFITVVRDQVMIGGINSHEMRVHWSGTNNSTQWTPGSNNCDFQDAASGGPVTGVLGGEVGYVFQRQRVTRMTQTPGQATIYQFDEVLGASGCVAASSLVQVGLVAFYFASDGFRMLDMTSGASKVLGVNKWHDWVLNDLRPGSESQMLGMFDPRSPVVRWPYISTSNTGTTPDRVLIYNWVLDEASFVDMNIEASAALLTTGVTLDGLDALDPLRDDTSAVILDDSSGVIDIGNIDTLPFSLDSPVWKGGTPVMGVFSTDHALSYQNGAPVAAQWITADGAAGQRALITGSRPQVDAPNVTVAIAARERDGDVAAGNVVMFPQQENMEDTGICPAWTSGNLARAKIQIPAASQWTLAKGIETMIKPRGRR
jgi:hypothetical protein